MIKGWEKYMSKKNITKIEKEIKMLKVMAKKVENVTEVERESVTFMERQQERIRNIMES